MSGHDRSMTKLNQSPAVVHADDPTASTIRDSQVDGRANVDSIR